MTEHDADLRELIRRNEGAPYTFVVQAMPDQTVRDVERRIATWLAVENADALKALGVSVFRMPDADAPPASENLPGGYVVVVLPLAGTMMPEQLFQIAAQIRQAGPFEQVDADVPVSYFIPERDASPREDEDERLPRRSGLTLSGGNCSPESSGQWPWPTDWSLTAMNVQKAWALGSKGRGVTIALLDTGWANHTHINPAVFDRSHCRDLLDGDDDPTDPLDPQAKGILLFPGHGTATASVACALRGPEVTPPPSTVERTIPGMFQFFLRKREETTPNEPPKPLISGVAPEAKLLPIRFTNTVASVTGYRLIEAINCIVELKKSDPDAVHIISLSQGCLPFPWVRDAVRRAIQHNLIVVASAGNWPKPVIWPAAFPECIAVAGISPDSHPWPCTARGAAVAFCTPAGQVWRATFRPDPETGTRLVPTFEPGSGTSFAAPHAAGVAALWIAHFTPEALRGVCERKGLVMQELFRTLAQQTASIPPDMDRADWIKEYGAGILDAEALLKADPEQVPPATVMRAFRRPETAATVVSQMAGDYAMEPPSDARRGMRLPGAPGSGAVPPEAVMESTLHVYAELLGVEEADVEPMLEANRAEVFHILLQHPAIFDQLAQEILQRSAGPEAAFLAATPDGGMLWLKQAFREHASPALIER